MIDVQRNGDHAVVRLRVEQLDATRSDELKPRLFELVDDRCRRIVLDLQDVTFIDSTALGVLVAVLRRARGQGEIALAGARPDVLGLFRLTGLDRVFPVFPTVEDAVASFAARPL